MPKQDLRVKKTIAKLTEVLIMLLQKQRFSKITINQICMEASVHRTTFYKHFKDKNELLMHVLDATTKPYFNNDVNKRMLEPFSCLDTCKRLLFPHLINGVSIQIRNLTLRC